MKVWQTKPPKDVRESDGTTHPAPRPDSDFDEIECRYFECPYTNPVCEIYCKPVKE